MLFHTHAVASSSSCSVVGVVFLIDADGQRGHTIFFLPMFLSRVFPTALGISYPGTEN